MTRQPIRLTHQTHQTHQTHPTHPTHLTMTTMTTMMVMTTATTRSRGVTQSIESWPIDDLPQLVDRLLQGEAAWLVTNALQPTGRTLQSVRPVQVRHVADETATLILMAQIRNVDGSTQQSRIGVEIGRKWRDNTVHLQMGRVGSIGLGVSKRPGSAGTGFDCAPRRGSSDAETNRYRFGQRGRQAPVLPPGQKSNL